MQVVQVMADGGRGGGADHLLGLMPELAKLGVRCTAISGSAGPLLARARAQDIPVHSIEMLHSRTSLRVARRLAALLQRLQPDLVHYHGTRAATYGSAVRLLSRLRGTPTVPSVYTAHGLAYRQPAGRLLRHLRQAAERLACGADAVISVSRSDLANLQRRGALPKQRLQAHVANAVDVRRFAPGNVLQARQHLGLPSEGFFIGTTARLVPQKAVGDLLDAVAAMPNNLLPQAQVVVIGDGPQRAVLAQHPLSRAGRVFFLGARDDVAACLPAFDVFALTSHWEGEPIVLLEALACGLPCVASRTPGAVEILADGLGILRDIGDAAGFAQCFSALQADDAARAAYGCAGVQAMQQRTHAHQAKKILALYERVLPPQHTATPS